MKIKISDMENHLFSLNSLIDELENSYLNGYKNLNDAKNYWRDAYSIKFFNHLEKEKVNVQNICDELKTVSGVYEFLIEHYSKIGDDIFFNDVNASEALDKLDKCLNFGEKIYRKYNMLSLYGNNYGVLLIKDQIKKISEDLEKMRKLKSTIKEMFVEIESIEKKVKEKIVKIDLEIIKESDIDGFF